MKKSAFAGKVTALFFLVLAAMGMPREGNYAHARTQAHPPAVKASSCVQRTPSHKPGSVTNPIKIKTGQEISGTLEESKYTSQMIYYLEVEPEVEYLIRVEGINAVYSEDAIAHMKYIGVDVSQKQIGEEFLAREKINEGETGKDVIVGAKTKCLFIRLWGWAHANNVNYKFKVVKAKESGKRAETPEVPLTNTFSNPEHGYAVSFPEGWVHEISGNAVLFSGKEGTEEYFTTVNLQSLLSEKAGGKYADLESVFLALKSQLESAGGKVSRPEVFEYKSRGRAYPAVRFISAYSMRGENFRQETFVIKRDDMYFLQLSYTAPEDLFDKHRETGLSVIASLDITPEEKEDSAAALEKKDAEILRVLREHYLESNIEVTRKRAGADTVWYYFDMGVEISPEEAEALKPELQGAAETAQRWAETVAVLYGNSQKVRIILHGGDTVIFHAEFSPANNTVTVAYGGETAPPDSAAGFKLTEIFKPANAAAALEARLANTFELEGVSVSYDGENGKTRVRFEHPGGMNAHRLMILYLALLAAGDNYFPYSEHVELIVTLGGRPFLGVGMDTRILRSFASGEVSRADFFKHFKVAPLGGKDAR